MRDGFVAIDTHHLGYCACVPAQLVLSTRHKSACVLSLSEALLDRYADAVSRGRQRLKVWRMQSTSGLPLSPLAHQQHVEGSVDDIILAASATATPADVTPIKHTHSMF